MLELDGSATASAPAGPPVRAPAEYPHHAPQSDPSPVRGSHMGLREGAGFKARIGAFHEWARITACWQEAVPPFAPARTIVHGAPRYDGVEWTRLRQNASPKSASDWLRSSRCRPPAQIVGSQAHSAGGEAHDCGFAAPRRAQSKRGRLRAGASSRPQGLAQLTPSQPGKIQAHAVASAQWGHGTWARCEQRVGVLGVWSNSQRCK